MTLRNAMKRAATLTTDPKPILPINLPKKLRKRQTKRKGTETLNATKPLISLGKLYQGTILRRPSLKNKSPYVADVRLDDGGN